MKEKWTVTFKILRKKGNEKTFFQSFKLEVNPDEYVLDGVERIWAIHDKSLVFRHACHHSTCGACGMLVNGVEKLTCITEIRSVTQDGGTLKIEPLRNFPIDSDLAVDMGSLYLNMEKSKQNQVAEIDKAILPFEQQDYSVPDGNFERLIDCIECGLCISACPSSTTSSDYLGPAVLAAIHHTFTITEDDSLLDLADSHNGVWRCHNAFECSEVCPSNVDPGWRIMDLRKKIISKRIRKIFRIREEIKTS
ncbi:MAG: succinate dehydrogenase/fumarate reductase iron-sulfur subunit [Anaerolineaceae bacterium]|nr:succinate dehydrogenase/fumarate reductase iron-sulfur subunit [Anaerolineaceae bacterium]